ncbi:MAG: hypothetical protein ABIU09_02295 [Pyrinomonadaceae bacterium]
MNRIILGSGKFAFLTLVGLGLVFSVADINAQGTRRKRAVPTTARTVPPVQNTEPQIISRAEDFPDTETQPLLINQPLKSDEADNTIDASSKAINELKKRVRGLETVKKNDRDEKQKRLMMNLDILTKAEQRADSLRRQLFEMIEKESTIRTRLDMIEANVRPETIDREVAFAGSLRPEELRAMRKKSLEIERTNLQALIIEVQKTRTNIDQNVQKADLLVEKMRLKLEKEIDDALTDEPTKP